MNRYLVFTIALLLSTACRKKETGSPQEQLPPITYTGANTFGCLIDGKLFKPKRNIGSTSIILQCNYQYFNDQHHFLLAAHDIVENCSVVTGMIDIVLKNNIFFNYSNPNLILGSCGDKKKNGWGYEYTTLPANSE